MFSRLLSYRNVNILLALIMLAGAAGLVAERRLARPEPPPQFASDEEHFLFGSIGTEATDGIPYWVWLVLPRVFPDHLPRPGGYAALGFLARDGHELPVGLSKVTIGFPRVGINCAACHTARYRRSPDDVPTVVPGAPQAEAGAQQYLRFLFDAASDPRFNASAILAEIARNYELSFVDRLLYRFFVIPRTRSALLAQQTRYAWMKERPDWGRGRIDAINSLKFGLLRQGIDNTVGTADMMPVWNLQAHLGHAFSWDGFNTDLAEVTRVSALASGATAEWIDRDFRAWDNSEPGQASSLRRVQNFMSGLAAPKYPLSIDQALAATGRTVFESTCASCHAPDGARTWTSIPVDEVATDRHRLDSWTEDAARASNDRIEGRGWKFAAFKKTAGYLAKPLEGIWLRGPYLHNGSVPSLMDLLETPERRPARFWRGYDVLDASGVGFIASGPEAERVGTRFDTSLPGNSNEGHLYGTGLPADSKRALLEFLKTL
jgi:mono/diheme cytochrome c family protein